MRQVFFWLDRQKIELPIAKGPEETQEIVWRPARYHAVLSVLKNPIYAGPRDKGSLPPKWGLRLSSACLSNPPGF